MIESLDLTSILELLAMFFVTGQMMPPRQQTATNAQTGATGGALPSRATPLEAEYDKGINEIVKLLKDGLTTQSNNRYYKNHAYMSVDTAKVSDLSGKLKLLGLSQYAGQFKGETYFSTDLINTIDAKMKMNLSEGERKALYEVLSGIKEMSVVRTVGWNSGNAITLADGSTVAGKIGIVAMQADAEIKKHTPANAPAQLQPAATQPALPPIGIPPAHASAPSPTGSAQNAQPAGATPSSTSQPVAQPASPQVAPSIDMGKIVEALFQKYFEKNLATLLNKPESISTVIDNIVNQAGTYADAIASNASMPHRDLIEEQITSSLVADAETVNQYTTHIAGPVGNAQQAIKAGLSGIIPMSGADEMFKFCTDRNIAVGRDELGNYTFEITLDGKKLSLGQGALGDAIYGKLCNMAKYLEAKIPPSVYNSIMNGDPDQGASQNGVRDIIQDNGKMLACAEIYCNEKSTPEERNAAAVEIMRFIYKEEALLKRGSDGTMKFNPDANIKKDFKDVLKVLKAEFVASGNRADPEDIRVAKAENRDLVGRKNGDVEKYVREEWEKLEPNRNGIIDRMHGKAQELGIPFTGGRSWSEDAVKNKLRENFLRENVNSYYGAKIL